jgi:hypothetical protein
LRSVTPCRTKSWRSFRPGLWDDCKLECQRIATKRVGGIGGGLRSWRKRALAETRRGRCPVTRLLLSRTNQELIRRCQGYLAGSGFINIYDQCEFISSR